jgi:cation:H+ antiporter
MPTSLVSAGFLVGLVASLVASWVLVARLERLGARARLPEALLGLVAALAADGPEITSSVTALLHRQQKVGAGVTLGSCLFNMAAMLGLVAVVARQVRFHRRVVALAAGVSVWMALAALLGVLGALAPGGALGMAAAGFAGYVAALVAGPRRLSSRVRWLAAAVHEEEVELAEAVHPRAGGLADAAVGSAALAVVIAASVLMERSATTVSRRLGVSDLVVGALVLAAATSVPNAVGALYLARRKRAAAVLSIAMNSNNLNILAGFLLPAATLGIGARSAASVLVAGWCAGLTLLVAGVCYGAAGLTRRLGAVVIAGYLAFVAAAVALG